MNSHFLDSCVGEAYYWIDDDRTSRVNRRLRELSLCNPLAGEYALADGETFVYFEPLERRGEGGIFLTVRSSSCFIWAKLASALVDLGAIRYEDSALCRSRDNKTPLNNTEIPRVKRN